jgi:hypothetical protein
MPLRVFEPEILIAGVIRNDRDIALKVTDRFISWAGLAFL